MENKIWLNICITRANYTVKVYIIISISKLFIINFRIYL